MNMYDEFVNDTNIKKKLCEVILMSRIIEPEWQQKFGGYEWRHFSSIDGP